jgi:hypothetical protein
MIDLRRYLALPGTKRELSEWRTYAYITASVVIIAVITGVWYKSKKT